MSSEEDQALIAAALASMPPPDVPGDFLSRVNARIDQSEGWFGVADFRAWTLRLAPVAAGLGLIAVLWPGAATSTTSSSPSSVTASTDFSPASATDWQQDVSADALLAAALTRADNGR
jgi:hypothetical protein